MNRQNSMPLSSRSQLLYKQQQKVHQAPSNNVQNQYAFTCCECLKKQIHQIQPYSMFKCFRCNQCYIKCQDHSAKAKPKICPYCKHLTQKIDHLEDLFDNRLEVQKSKSLQNYMTKVSNVIRAPNTLNFKWYETPFPVDDKMQCQSCKSYPNNKNIRFIVSFHNQCSKCYCISCQLQMLQKKNIKKKEQMTLQCKCLFKIKEFLDYLEKRCHECGISEVTLIQKKSKPKEIQGKYCIQEKYCLNCCKNSQNLSDFYYQAVQELSHVSQHLFYKSLDNIKGGKKQETLQRATDSNLNKYSKELESKGMQNKYLNQMQQMTRTSKQSVNFTKTKSIQQRGRQVPVVQKNIKNIKVKSPQNKIPLDEYQKTPELKNKQLKTPEIAQILVNSQKSTKKNQEQIKNRFKFQKKPQSQIFQDEQQQEPISINKQENELRQATQLSNSQKILQSLQSLKQSLQMQKLLKEDEKMTCCYICRKQSQNSQQVYLHFDKYCKECLFIILKDESFDKSYPALY